MKSRAGGIWGNEHCRAEFLYLCICLVFIYSDRGETSPDLTPRGCCPILALVPPRAPGHVRITSNANTMDTDPHQGSAHGIMISGMD